MTFVCGMEASPNDASAARTCGFGFETVLGRRLSHGLPYPLAFPKGSRDAEAGLGREDLLRRRRIMEHKPLTELEAIADVKVAEGAPAMSRDERLERWIAVLESNPRRRLSSLFEIEYSPPEKRRACRADNSPLTVAFDDPVLRREGLKSDRLGDCLDFFGITERHLHYA